MPEPVSPTQTIGAPPAVETLILTAEELAPLLDMRRTIELMEDALRGLDRGDWFQPLRTGMVAPGAPGVLGMMPAWVGGAEPAYGLKAGCMTPGNRALGIDLHQGVVVVYEGQTGRVRSVMNLSPVTAMRTAAVSAVATRALARPDASRLCLIGSGLQAEEHLAAIAQVRELSEATVWSPTTRNVEAFAERVGGRYPFPVRATATAEEAVRQADIVVTATPAREPVIERSWLAPGTHVNAVGSCTPFMREIDAATVAASIVIVDRRDSAQAEAGDLIQAEQEGAIGPDHVRGELGELLNGRCEGRRSADELTLFESLGLGAEDLAVALELDRHARAAGIGKIVAF